MDNSDRSVVVAGAGGFIGGHLVAQLMQQGYSSIRAIDIKPMDQWYQIFKEIDNKVLDLKKETLR